MQHEQAAGRAAVVGDDGGLHPDLWTTPALQEESAKGGSGLRQSIRLQFGAVAPSHHGYPPTSVLNNSPASRRAMESNQASKVSVEPFLHSSFPSRKPRRVIVPSDRALDLPSRPCFSCGAAQEVGVVVTAFCEHAPGHAREFCG